MLARPECVACIYRTRAAELAASRLPEDVKVAKLRALTEHYALLVAPGVATTVLAWRAFAKVKELLGEEDPYREFKEESRRVAESLARKVRSAAEGKVGLERLRYLIRASVAANYLDPGSPMGLEPGDLLRAIEAVRFGRDETGRLYGQLLASRAVAYVLDNSGEALFDALVMEELRRMGLELFIVARGKPYQNDVTYEEALQMGLDRLGTLISSGTDFPGVVPGFVSSEAVEALRRADVVISKGMANFESFLLSQPPKPTFIVLTAKCLPIAAAAGVRPGEAAAFFLGGAPGPRDLL
ncbi:MAG: ARMT1-like domain-containing protein [Thermofilum sp.]